MDAFRRGEFRDSVLAYSEALRLNPQSAVAYNNRGVAHERLGAVAQALEDYGRAIQLDPQYFMALRNQGNLALRDRRYEIAVESLSRAIRLRPSDEEIRKNLQYASEALREQEEEIRRRQQEPPPNRTRGLHGGAREGIFNSWIPWFGISPYSRAIATHDHDAYAAAGPIRRATDYCRPGNLGDGWQRLAVQLGAPG
jgi:tetratricopeptide (TPR) repeat protein